MMNAMNRPYFLPLGAIALSLLAGCGSADSTPASARKSPAESAAPASTNATDGINRCALLTDDEINSLIGPHQPGSNDVSNEWGLQTCRWMATTAPKSKAPKGWREEIEVTVFFKEKTSWAREQARGEPVQGVVDGATYDSSYGVVWFNCARDRFCMVKARTASGANREQLAIQLAKTVLNRLR